MRYDPGELYSKLTSLGVNISEPEPLRNKCIEVREKRAKKVNKEPDKEPYRLPNIDYLSKGRPLKDIPKRFIGDVLNFVGYLSDTAKRSFCIKMRNKLTGAYLPPKWKPYVHRWTDIYKKGILAKMYLLEGYYGEDISELEFITLTTYQRGFDQEEAMLRLNEGLKKLLDLLRFRYGAQDYVWMREAHKSGYSHVHLVYFKKLTDLEKEGLQKIWHEKYGLGSEERGLYFSPPRASEDGLCPAGSIKSIRSYLMKYISKGLYSDSLVSESMEKGELLFNSLLKKTKSRLWGCSRNLSRVMKRPVDPKSEEFECVEVDQYYGVNLDEIQEFYQDETKEEQKTHFYSVLWTKDKGLRPDLVKKWKFIASTPILLKSDIERIEAGKIRMEDYPDRKQRYLLYEPYWAPV